MDPTESLGAGERRRYHPPRGRLLGLVVTCLFIVAVSYLPTRADLPFLVGLGWTMIVLLSLAAVVLLLRALRPGPTVIIDDLGITDRTTLAPAGFLPWGDITVIRKKEIGRGMGAERLLEVVLSDQAEFHARPRSWLRRLTEGYRRLLKQPVLSIPASMVSVPMQAVMDEIRQRRPELQILEGPPPAPSKFRWGTKPQSRRQHPDLPRW